MDRLVDATVRWIKNGFKNSGGPFLDVEAMFEDIGNQAIGEIANQSVGALCAPMKLSLAISNTQEPKPFSKQMSCSLSNIVDNVENLFKDFRAESKGNWITYATLWEPQNNFYGGSIKMQDEKDKLINSYLYKKNAEATISLGFSAQKNCKYDPSTGKDVCETTTPGQTVGNWIGSKMGGEDEKFLLFSSSEWSAYIAAIADALLYRYTILGIGGLKDLLGYSSADLNKEAGTAWADYTESAFGQLEAISFENTRALYLDEIRTTLASKRAALTYINQSLNTENTLLETLQKLQSCTLPEASATNARVVAMASLFSYIDEVNTAIANLETKKSQIENDISDLDDAMTSFGQYTYKQNTTMVTEYSALVANGTLSADAAATTLAEAQDELASLKLDAKNLLESTAPTGYLDIIPICASQAAQ